MEPPQSSRECLPVRGPTQRRMGTVVQTRVSQAPQEVRSGGREVHPLPTNIHSAFPPGTCDALSARVPRTACLADNTVGDMLSGPDGSQRKEVLETGNSGKMSVWALVTPCPTLPDSELL